MAKKNEIDRREPADGDAALARVGSLSLDQLARHANAEAREAEGRALFHACRAGIFLLEAKARVQAKGAGWYEWLAEEWHQSRQHADRYMQLADACSRDPKKIPTLRVTSIRGALQALGKPVDGRKSETPQRKPLQSLNSDRSRVSGDSPPVTDAEFTVHAPAPLPGARCPVCRTEVALRPDGKLHMHRVDGADGDVCRWSIGKVHDWRGRPVVLVDRARLDHGGDVCKASSVQQLAEGRPVLTFEFEGARYTATGSSYATDYIEAECWRLVPRAEWTGPVYTREELEARWDRFDAEGKSDWEHQRGNDTGHEVRIGRERGATFVLAECVVFTSSLKHTLELEDDDDQDAPAPAMPQLPAPVPIGALPPPAEEPCEDCGSRYHVTGADVCPGAYANDDDDQAAPVDDYVDPDPRELALHTLERHPLDPHAVFTLLYNSPAPLPGFVSPYVLGRDVSHVQHVMALLREVWSQLDFKLEHKQFKNTEEHRLMAALRDRLTDCCTMAEEAVTRRHGQRAEDARRADVAAERESKRGGRKAAARG